MDLHCLVPLFKSVCGLCSKHTKAKQNTSVISYWLTELDIEKLLRYCKPLFIPIAAPDVKNHRCCKAMVVGQDPREVMAMWVGWLCSAEASAPGVPVVPVWSVAWGCCSSLHTNTGKQWALRSCTVKIRVGPHWVWVRGWETLASLIRCNCNYWC